MKDDLIRRKDALNFELTVEAPPEAEEAILRTSQGIMDHIKRIPSAGEDPGAAKLQKRSQAERLTIALSLVAGVEEEIRDGNREHDLLELAQEISSSAWRITSAIYHEIVVKLLRGQED